VVISNAVPAYKGIIVTGPQIVPTDMFVIIIMANAVLLAASGIGVIVLMIVQANILIV